MHMFSLQKLEIYVEFKSINHAPIKCFLYQNRARKSSEQVKNAAELGE